MISHKELWERGILHRDISPGNVLLCERGDAHVNGVWGYLTDLDFARFPEKKPVITVIEPVPVIRERGYLSPFDHDKETVMRKHKRFGTKSEVERGAEMTARTVDRGTAQFFAEEVLQAMCRNTTVPRQATHDVQSFIWTGSYCLLRNLLRKLYRISRGKNAEATEAEHKTVRDLFEEMYGKANHTFQSVVEYCAPGLQILRPDSLEFQIFRKHKLISKPLSDFMGSCTTLLFPPGPKQFPQPSHGDLLAAPDASIAQFEASDEE
ncbi:hypothetical protein D9613_012222 [Agrocybe pediades]|uniref:Protein kinase domain-containing protein n=1 Tax=Agrocybe pediades TaxID=84607 RepID=A0A8H4QEH5_9AGAR|nr:hypothetical protein D9613_012222 [Agrocybe pediades]